MADLLFQMFLRSQSFFHKSQCVQSDQQSDISFLDQVLDHHSPMSIVFRDLQHPIHIMLSQAMFCLHITICCLRKQSSFFFFRTLSKSFPILFILLQKFLFFLGIRCILHLGKFCSLHMNMLGSQISIHQFHLLFAKIHILQKFLHICFGKFPVFCLCTGCQRRQCCLKFCLLIHLLSSFL